MIASWPSPTGDDEYAVSFDHGRTHRLLILPALFEEANKTRHLLVEVMRRLDMAGIDSFLPDLPGCNESLADISQQTIDGWQRAALAAADHFAATRVLAIRASAILAPPALPGWRYAAISGASALRSLVRARQITSQEAGKAETTDNLMSIGREQGLTLAGYTLGAEMLRDLEGAHVPDSGVQRDIQHLSIGGTSPWLRAEPGFDPDQADALAALISVEISQ